MPCELPFASLLGRSNPIAGLLPGSDPSAAATTAVHTCSLTATAAATHGAKWLVSVTCQDGSEPPLQVHPGADLVLNGKHATSTTTCSRSDAQQMPECLIVVCGQSSVIRFKRSSIKGVQAPQLQGVLCAIEGAQVYVEEGSVVAGNTAAHGALHAAGRGTLLAVSDCRVQGNRATAESETMESDLAGAQAAAAQAAYL